MAIVHHIDHDVGDHMALRPWRPRGEAGQNRIAALHELARLARPGEARVSGVERRHLVPLSGIGQIGVEADQPPAIGLYRAAFVFGHRRPVPQAARAAKRGLPAASHTCGTFAYVKDSF